MQHGDGVTGVGPEAVEQTVQPRAVLTVLFWRFRASVAHHVDVRARTEVLPHAVQHKQAEQRAVASSSAPAGPALREALHSSTSHNSVIISVLRALYTDSRTTRP